MFNRTEEDIIKKWPKNFETTTPVVSIRCTTYNQEEYIAECLESLLMQETNFYFQIFVHEDASTDNTANIVKEYALKYPRVIKALCETENQYSKQDGTFTRIINQHLIGKYIAVCEGDDYWVDPNKLQKQVDFLEENTEYGMCYGLAHQYNQKKEKFISDRGENYKSLDYYLNHHNCITTLTVCYKKELYFEYLKYREKINKKWPMGDLPMWIWFIKNSKVKFFNECLGVYRILSNSAAHSTNIEKQIAFYKAGYDCANFFSKKYLNKELPPFNEHAKRAHLYSIKVKNRMSAYSEYKMISKENIKYKVLAFMHSNLFLYKLLLLYYHFRYKQ